LFLDSGFVIPIRYYNAPDGARVLPYVQFLANIEFEEDKWYPYVPGEVAGSPHPYASRAVPPGADGLHFHGTAAEWEFGATFDPLANYDFFCRGPGGQAQGGIAPVLQAWTARGGEAQGGLVPVQASAVVSGSGGEAQGGLVPVQASAVVSGSGGEAQGGLVPVQASAEESGSGGSAQGGTAPVTAPLAPGHTCLTAGAIAIGQSYTGTIVSGSDDWFVFPVVSGTHYTVTLTAVGFAPVNTNVAHGSCASLVNDGLISNSGTIAWTSGVTGSEWIHSTIFIGSKVYTIALNSP